MTFLRHFGRCVMRSFIFAFALFALTFPSFADNECSTGYHWGTLLPDASVAPVYNSYKYKSNNGYEYCDGMNGGCFSAPNFTPEQQAWADAIPNGYMEISWDSGMSGTLKGKSICAAENGVYGQATTTDLSNVSSSGSKQYCWCKVTEFAGQSLSSAWVFRADTTQEMYCVNECTGYCMKHIRDESTFRSAILGAVTDTPAGCIGNAYSVAFNANGGTGEMANQGFTYGTAQNLTANTFTRDDYIFAGWNTSADGTGTPYNDTESVSNLTTEADATITLYAQWEPVKFSITTTNLSVGDEFKFDMTAVGTFYVDCGVDGILSSNASTNDVYGKKIVRENTNIVKYTCQYSSGGVKTIKFGGLASEYSTSTCSSAISFGQDTSAQFIASISGSLGEMFPSYDGDYIDKKPQFCATFQNAINLTLLPVDSNGHSTLFSGISSFGYNMFGYVFAWSGLTSVPSDLFSGISGGAKGFSFMNAFAYCSALTKVTYPDGSETTYLPYNFFGDIDMKNNAVSGAFSNIFNGANANFSTSCPTGTTQYTTVYDNQFNGKILCQPATYSVTYDCNEGNNDGIPIPFVQLIQYGFKFNNESNCTYAGHTLQSWSCTNATSGEAFTLPSNNSTWDTVLDNGTNINCVANWGNTVYTINFKDADGNALNVNGATSTTWTFGDNDFVLPDENDVLQNNSGKLFNGWYDTQYTEHKFSKNSYFNQLTMDGVRFGSDLSSEYIVGHADEENSLNIYAHVYKKPVFEMITTQMSANEVFAFMWQYAKGNIYVDWGDGQIQKYVVSSSEARDTIGHEYTEPAPNGGWHIKLSSEIEDYCMDCSNRGANLYVAKYGDGGVEGSVYCSSIPFVDKNYNADNIGQYYTNGWTTYERLAGIDGKLGQLLPTIGNKSPRFIGSFCGCKNLKGTIPENFFEGVEGEPTLWMFWETFRGTGLTGVIPGNIFSRYNSNNQLTGIKGTPSSFMFYYTFADSNDIEGIGDHLFDGVYKTASYVFGSTFMNCSGLINPIPQNLFSNVSGAPAANMYNRTFAGCSNLPGPIPENLFGNISGAPAESMYNRTFEGCSNLSGPIPENLFGNIYGAPAAGMYNSTFAECPKLTEKIPDNLFGNISGPIQTASYYRTFFGDEGLYGPIPENLFGNLTGMANYGFQETFKGAKNIMKDKDGNIIQTQIPINSFTNLTGASALTEQDKDTGEIYDARVFSGAFADTLPDGANANGYPYLNKNMFKGITGYISNNETGDQTTDTPYTQDGIFKGIFNNSAVTTICPANTYQYITGFEIDWDGRVACEPCPEGFVSSQGSVNITSCHKDCSINDEYGGVYVSELGGQVYSTGLDTPDNTDECIYNYTVTLDGTEGVQASLALTTYNKNTTERTLPDSDIMKKAGAIFNGWVDGNGNTATEIPADARGPVTYTAQWNECPNNSFCDGSSNTPTSCSTATNGVYTLSETGSTSINDCYRVETQSCASIVNYSISNGSVVYANETAQCKYYYGSNKCDLINESACNIENVNCSTGYNPGSTGQLVGVNVSNMSSSAVCPLGRTAYDENTDIAAMCSTLQSGWGYLEFNESSIGFERINGHLMCNSLNPYENIGFVVSLSELAERNPEMSQDDIIASMEHSSGMYCWAIVTDVDGTPLNNAPYVYWGSYDDAETCYTDCAWFAAHDNDMNRFLNGIIESMDELACVPQVHTISLIDDNNSKTIYTVYDSGVYSNENLFDSITNNNAFYDIPTKPGYIFAGYYSQQSDGIQYIDKDGYLTEQGRDAALGYIDDTYVWYAQWTSCPADSFCPGDNTSVSCATEIDNEDYKYSDGDHASVNDCYRNCVAGTDVPNATAVSGSVHYSANGEIKSCAPVNANSCATGYEYTEGFDSKTALPSVSTEPASNYQYHAKDDISEYAMTNNTSLNNGEWSVAWDNISDVTGVMKGLSTCTEVAGNTDWSENPSYNEHFNGEETGNNCWCKPTFFNNDQLLNTKWIYLHDSANYCLERCAFECANYMVSLGTYFRFGVFNAIQSSPATCSLKTYTITYNDGENTYTAEYNVEMESVQLATPTDKTGYAFDGWYTTDDYQPGTKIDSISTDSPRDLTLYANWINIYTITYNLNEGGWYDANYQPETTYTVENHITLPTASDMYRADYSFVGWCLDNPDCENVITSTSQLESLRDVTLYAKWLFDCPSEKYLHIGDSRMCLSETRGEGQVFVVMINGIKYYAKISPAEENLTVSKCSNTRLHIMVDGNNYTVHDNSASTQIQNCQ